MKTDDEVRVEQIEARIKASFHNGVGTISETDFKALSSSRLAWKFTSKCFATRDESVFPEQAGILDKLTDGLNNDTPTPVLILKLRMMGSSGDLRSTLGRDIARCLLHNAADRLETAERDALETAVGRMGWPEIHAYHAEMRKGQGIYEDAGGYIMRGLRRLFGLAQEDEEIITYRRAAKAMVKTALEANR